MGFKSSWLVATLVLVKLGENGNPSSSSVVMTSLVIIVPLIKKEAPQLLKLREASPSISILHSPCPGM